MKIQTDHFFCTKIQIAEGDGVLKAIILDLLIDVTFHEWVLSENEAFFVCASQMLSL